MSAVVAVKFSSIAIMSAIADATSARAEAMSTCDATMVRTIGTKKKKNQSTIKRQNEEEKKRFGRNLIRRLVPMLLSLISLNFVIYIKFIRV